MSEIELVAWDFDGVLNVNPGGKVFPWVANLDRDLGVPSAAFRRFLDRPGQARDVLRGEADLLERLTAWIEAERLDISAQAFLDHWLAADDRPDEEAVDWLAAQDGRRMIVTNNPPGRARYIAERTRAGALVEKVVASGEIGAAKPDPGFFAHVERVSGLSPDRILLIDDSTGNVAAAAARGWRVFRFGPDTRALLPKVLGI